MCDSGLRLVVRSVVMALGLVVAVIVANSAPGSTQTLDWSQIGADIDGEAAEDWSGQSVSLSADGSRVAIGARFNDGAGSRSGHVRVYERVGDGWVQVGADIDGEAAFDESGGAVSLSADGLRVAIGAGGNDGAGTNAGHVRVYERVGDGWVQVGADIDGEAAFDLSGDSVSLSADGSWVAIGARLNDGAGADAGHVRVFEWSGIAWVQVGADIDGEAEGDRSGGSVSLSADGSRVAIGAIGNDGAGADAGHVRVYERVGDGWVQVGADIDGEAAGDLSGWSVSLSADGSRVAIGAERNDGAGDGAGHVRVFEWSGIAWVQVGADIDGEAAGDLSGGSVSLSADGSWVAIGAMRNGGAGYRSGHVRVFEWSGSGWVQVGVDVDGEAAGDGSGWSVSLSGDGSAVAIGARFNGAAGYRSGHVRVFGWPVLCEGEVVTVDLRFGGVATEGPDVILGTSGADVIEALGGDDVVCAGEGDDFVDAGAGDDLVVGGGGDDRLLGRQGADVIFGGEGADTLHGNRGDDELDGGVGNDRIFGYAHDDVIRGGDGDDRLHGNFGDDQMWGGPGADRIFGYGDNDEIFGGDGNDLVGGNFGDDRIVGGPGDDVLYGSDGNDVVDGGHGNDQVEGNSLDDSVRGGPGNDDLDGGIGRDSCNGGTGTDTATRCETLTAIP